MVKEYSAKSTKPVAGTPLWHPLSRYLPGPSGPHRALAACFYQAISLAACQMVAQTAHQRLVSWWTPLQASTQGLCPLPSQDYHGFAKAQNKPGLPNPQHDFPNMCAGFHPGMGLTCINQRKFAVHHRGNFARRQQWPDMLSQLVRNPRFGQI